MTISDTERRTDVMTPGDAAWPVHSGRRVVFLVDAMGGLEERLLAAWIQRSRPSDVAPSHVEAIPIPSSRRQPRRRRLDPQLDACLASSDDPLLAPLRIAWQPAQRNGAHVVRLPDLLTFGDPRDPGRLRQSWLLRRHPDRCRVVAGDPAPVSELRDRWQRICGSDIGQTSGLADFVVRQATLALERAERRLRGARYKVPRLVHEEILARPEFRGALAHLARSEGRSDERITQQASRYLKEIAARHSPYVIDLLAHFIHLLYTRGYNEALHYDHRQLAALFALTQRAPVVFLPTHKSNLDHLVLQYALHENGLPPNHTAGGINMNFFPLGPLFRRSGVFFIRRTFKDNSVYKLVLRHYIDYLIEKRFSLEWYIEGGRSRSGKLLPPRYGLLAYVADAYRRGKSDDVFLIPVSIAYDQIQDVGDYAAEQRGAAKQRESFGWFVRLVRSFHRRYGAIHLRFGDPLSLAQTLGAPDPTAEPHADEQSLTLQKLAFEVSVRINRVTPITPTSLVTLALLGSGDRALTLAETMAALHNLLDYVRRRTLPTTGPLDLETPEGVRGALDSLVDSGVVSCFAEGPDPVYAVGPDQHLTAAYYRNTIIHFFINGAIAELALLRVADARPERPVDAFWDAAMRLRDLLKFEFFFAEKEVFRVELCQEIAFHDVDWEPHLAGSSADILGIVRRFRPLSAHRVLRPFLEAYQVVSDALLRRDTNLVFDEATFLAECLTRGKQYHLQRRIRSPESISKVLFESALRLARNRGLLDTASPDVATRRAGFAMEIRDAIRGIDVIDALVASRRAGLID